MDVAVIGVGPIGRAVSALLTGHGQDVVVASRSTTTAEALAAELGPRARALPLREAIAGAELVVLAVPFGAAEGVVSDHRDALSDTVVVDPTNAVEVTSGGGFRPILPEGRSAASLISAALPVGAHYVKALGTAPADLLGSGSERAPRQAVLFYATDDDVAEAAIAPLIGLIGFDAVKAGGTDAAGRLEVFSDLHTVTGFDGRLVDADEARAARDATAR